MGLAEYLHELLHTRAIYCPPPWSSVIYYSCPAPVLAGGEQVRGTISWVRSTKSCSKQNPAGTYTVYPQLQIAREAKREILRE